MAHPFPPLLPGLTAAAIVRRGWVGVNGRGYGLRLGPSRMRRKNSTVPLAAAKATSELNTEPTPIAKPTAGRKKYRATSFMIMPLARAAAIVRLDGAAVSV
jgi:hypothetical protein